MYVIELRKRHYGLAPGQYSGKEDGISMSEMIHQTCCAYILSQHLMEKYKLLLVYNYEA